MTGNLDLQVVFLDHSTHTVTVSGLDYPGAIALLGPPISCPVYAIHKGRCLSPFFSLLVQGVESGDLIILHGIREPDRLSVRFPDFGSEDTDPAFTEVLRLADIAFCPYETSASGGAMYDHMLQEVQASDDAKPAPLVIKTVLGEKSEKVSCRKLPTCWGSGTTRRRAEARSQSVGTKPKPKGRRTPC